MGMHKELVQELTVPIKVFMFNHPRPAQVSVRYNYDRKPESEIAQLVSRKQSPVCRGRHGCCDKKALSADQAEAGGKRAQVQRRAILKS